MHNKTVMFIFAFSAVIYGFFPISTTALESNTGVNLPTGVPLVELIANGDKYNGTRVIVIGTASVILGDNSLYLDTESFKHGVHPNSIFLPREFIDGMEESHRRLIHGRYVLVQGTFNHMPTDSLGYRGGLDNIERFEVWQFNREHEKEILDTE